MSSSRGCGGSESEDGHIRELVLEVAQTQVIGSEILSPLAHTVCLIDDEPGQTLSFVQLLECFVELLTLRQFLGCAVEQSHIRRILEDLVLLGLPTLVAFEELALDANGVHLQDLVLDEAEQGHDHEGDALLDVGGKLEGEALAATCLDDG